MIINIEKITIGLLFIVVIYLFKKQQQIKEHVTNTDVTNLDISTIKSLYDISQILVTDGLTVPGNIDGIDVNVYGQSNLVPKGCVVIWSGAADKIPSGWALCDGKTNNTPDLVDKFILGANAETLKDEKLKTGGNKNMTLVVANIVPHTHNGNTNPGGGHSHGLNRGTGRDNDNSSNVQFLSNNNGSIETSSNGEHTHTLTTDTGRGCVGTPFGIMPPYYKLCYIMKL
jgi:hypothetical protein